MNKFFYLTILIITPLLASAQNWEDLFDEGMSHYDDGNYTEAASFLEEARLAAEELFSKESLNYAKACYNLALVYWDQGIHDKAELFFLETLAIEAKLLGKDHSDYGTTCYDLASLYQDLGRYSEAEPLFLKSLAIDAKVLGNNHPDYANSCNNLAWFYEAQGRYSEAESLYLEALAIDEKTLGRNHLDYGTTCDNLASLYHNQGQYAKAEPLFLEVLAIRSNELGKHHPDYGTSCNNLAFLYQAQGRYTEAEPLFLEALVIYEKSLGKDHPYYSTSCNNLAMLYDTQGRFSDAESLYLEALSIVAKAQGDDHPDYATTCNNLGTLYQTQGRIAEAEQLYLEALDVINKAYGKDHPLYASPCNNLASLFKSQGLYSQAESLYKEALAIRKKALGKDHPKYATSCHNLALLYQAEGRYFEAEPLFKEGSHTLSKAIKRNFIGLSEKEKEQYLSTFKHHFELYYSFVLNNPQPELFAWLLENSLLTKGLLFFSTNQLRRTLEKTDDKNLKLTYERWLTKRKSLSQAYELGEQKRNTLGVSLDKLENEANELEKALSAGLAQRGIEPELLPRMRSWQEIKQKLNDDEALVELTRIHYFDTDWTDSVMYVAMVVKKNSVYPELLVLPNGNELEQSSIAKYRNAINYYLEDNDSYYLFFGPLMESMKGIKKLYFSADGVYHQLNLATLYNPETKKYLGEDLNIQLISTARDFLDLELKRDFRKLSKDSRLDLFGYPDFAGKYHQKMGSLVTPTHLDTSLEKLIDENQPFFEDQPGLVTYLPGTKKEIEIINKLARKNKVKTRVYLAKNATEGNLKAISSPTILHIATHGFFIAATEENRNLNRENTYFDNPLQRAGLLLAGAELTLNKLELPGKENGILTAQEAMDLDLMDTDLVVLSACETGLGEIQNGEGVFGLQRALQQAGAKSVLMSLWTVDDMVTHEMMSLFYENMLVKKQDKRSAFSNAQNEIKRQYESPYYWGAFVMVGE